MGKQPVKMRAVVYALSPFQQKIMSGLWKDLPGKISHKVSENWISATLLLAPLVGTYTQNRGTAVVACSPLCHRSWGFTLDHSVFSSSMERIALAYAWQQFRHHFPCISALPENI
ncbi:hypothetical protein J1N35_042588 [Gossypium stocksii]|uniref:Cytochrome b-c1 complex subunit 8 n=1 Tax=Gossypium stocksii TaxID=47602 RepID=A0A9D3U5U0_9ROSI|nr:hypothetical protein J1N35_042588 [Gossypium stocksii]